MVTDTVKVVVGNKRATYLISGIGLILNVHQNHDEYGDYYRVLWGGEVHDFFSSNFRGKIS